MQECNPPRINWLQTHQDDGRRRGEAQEGFSPVVLKKTTAHRIDRFAHASKNSNVALATTVLGASSRIVRP